MTTEEAINACISVRDDLQTDGTEKWHGAQRCVMALRTLQASRPEAVAKEPICYAIFNAKGEMHWSESCISKQRDDLEDELEILTDSEMPPNSEGWHIAPLYTLLSPRGTCAPAAKDADAG